MRPCLLHLWLIAVSPESPEPSGDAILASYPEGLYRFRGRS